MKKTPLTIKEARSIGFYTTVFLANDVYSYYKYNYAEESLHTLVEEGKILIENVYDVHWFKKGMFTYLDEGGQGLVENYKKVLEKVEHISIYDSQLGIYTYQIPNKKGRLFATKCTLVKKGKIIIKNADYIDRYKEEIFIYIKKNKWYIKDIKENY